MAKTLKQIADELGVDKQQVYRYCKKHSISGTPQNCSDEAHQKNSVFLYDDVEECLIKEGFLRKSASDEALQKHFRSTSKSTSENTFYDVLLDTVQQQLELLQKELDVKNEQIAALQSQNAALVSQNAALMTSLSNAQALHAGTLQKQLEAVSTTSDAVPDEAAEHKENERKKGFFARFWRK